ncbi:hypothetical protein ACOMHN_015874 [Nucella lapillus]
MSGRGRQQWATKRPQRLTEHSPPSARKRQRPQPPDHSRRPETSRRSPSPAPSWPVQPVPTAEQIAAFLRAQPQPPTSTTTSNTSAVPPFGPEGSRNCPRVVNPGIHHSTTAQKVDTSEADTSARQAIQETDTPPTGG